MSTRFFSKEELEMYLKNFYYNLDSGENHELCKRSSRYIREIEYLLQKKHYTEETSLEDFL
ncbi:hypothetical protein YTPLAS73_11240 [Nitrosarchaeum sp.]|nr:hypothetical protein YTPLAS73_11240 [Nitrosarchaeum sp.]